MVDVQQQTNSASGDITEVIKLTNALTLKWISPERFTTLLDYDNDGRIDYNEFYNGMSQFGFTKDVDVNACFKCFPQDVDGKVVLADMAKMLKNPLAESKTTLDPVEDEELDEDLDTLLVGLVAHNNMKPSMMLFVKQHLAFFKKVKLVTTGSTGRALTALLGLKVDSLVSSGPLGGDQEIGGKISTGQVAAVFFFTDPLSAHPHEADSQALNRICCVHDTMFANNPSTAHALVYALEHTSFGFAKLLGVHPTYLKDDTAVVQTYKNNQAKVISQVQADNQPKVVSLKAQRASIILAARKSMVASKKGAGGFGASDDELSGDDELEYVLASIIADTTRKSIESSFSKMTPMNAPASELPPCTKSTTLKFLSSFMSFLTENKTNKRSSINRTSSEMHQMKFLDNSIWV